MPNYQGNIDLYQSGFKTNRDESCTALIGIRVPPSVKEKLVQEKGWQEKVRNLIAEYVEKVPPKSA